MSPIQQARLDLAVILDAVTPDGWKVRTETDPDKHTGTIEVGHVNTIEPRSYKSALIEIPVTLWVNESDRKLGVDQLYMLLDPFDDDGLGVLLSGKVDVPDTERTLSFGQLTTGNVGPRDEGPTGFLAADITVEVKLTPEFP